VNVNDLDSVILRRISDDEFHQSGRTAPTGFDAPLWRRLNEQPRSRRRSGPPELSVGERTARMYAKLELAELVLRGVGGPLVAEWNRTSIAWPAVSGGLVLDEAVRLSGMSTRQQVLSPERPLPPGIDVVVKAAVEIVSHGLDQELEIEPTRLAEASAFVDRWDRPLSWLPELLWLQYLTLWLSRFAGRRPVTRFRVPVLLQHDIHIPELRMTKGMSASDAHCHLREMEEQIAVARRHVEAARRSGRHPRAAWLRKICRDVDWYYRRWLADPPESTYAIANSPTGPGPDAVTTVSRAILRAQSHLEDRTSA
jgi:hypothetical protein